MTNHNEKDASSVYFKFISIIYLFIFFWWLCYVEPDLRRTCLCIVTGVKDRCLLEEITLYGQHLMLIVGFILFIKSFKREINVAKWLILYDISVKIKCTIIQSSKQQLVLVFEGFKPGSIWYFPFKWQMIIKVADFLPIID